jgi:hypothetical protein
MRAGWEKRAGEGSISTEVPRDAGLRLPAAAIILPGHKRMKMSELEAALCRLGFDEVKTYRQSGSLIFRAPQPGSKLSVTVEVKIQSAFGFSEMGWPRAAP